MNITTFFKLVKAPLKNNRTSWGAVRKDGKVVLRVWQHRISGMEVLVKHNGMESGPGRTERSAHLATGKNFYCVVCIHNHDKGTIQSFDKRELWYGNQLRTDDQGNVWLKLLHRVPVGNLL